MKYACMVLFFISSVTKENTVLVQYLHSTYCIFVFQISFSFCLD